MGKEARKRRKQHLPPAVDHKKGAELAAAAGARFVEELREHDIHLSRLVGPARGVWSQTRVLPGYHEALVSAQNALTTLVGRLKFVREVYPAISGQVPWDAKTMAMLLSTSRANGWPVRNLIKYRREFSEAGLLKGFDREVLRREKNEQGRLIPNPIDTGGGQFKPLPAPLNDLPALPFYLTVLWVRAGFWLSTNDAIVGNLKKAGLRSFRGSAPVVITPSNVDTIVSDLRLMRYSGKGRMSYDEGKLTPDDALRSEVRAASGVTGELERSLLNLILSAKSLGESDKGEQSPTER